MLPRDIQYFLNTINLYLFYTKRYFCLTFQTSSVHQNKSRQTMTNTVIVYTDTLCIVYRTGTSIIPHYVFTCEMSCVSSLFVFNLLLPLKKLYNSDIIRKKSQLYFFPSLLIHNMFLDAWLTCVPRCTINIKSFRKRSCTQGGLFSRIAYRQINFS